MTLLIANLVSIAFAISSGVCCARGVSGWGWLAFCAILCHALPSSSKENKE